MTYPRISIINFSNQLGNHKIKTHAPPEGRTMSKVKNDPVKNPARRNLLKYAAATGISAPFINSVKAAPTEINMLAWYGHGEPDVVGAYEEANNVKFNAKYYAGGDNMLALVSQSPPGTYDVILSDAEFVSQLNAAGYIEEMDAGAYNLDDNDGSLWSSGCFVQHQCHVCRRGHELQKLLEARAQRQSWPL